MTIIMQALRAARRMIETERNWFLDNLAIPDERGILHPDDKETLKDYDDVLALVRDAIAAMETPKPVAFITRGNELRQEVERLRADAARYRWLRGGPDVPSYSSRWPRWEVRYWDKRYWQTMFAEDLDAAIDAAMKEESGEQSTSSFENFMEIPYGAR